MTHIHATDFQETQPYHRPRSAARPVVRHARRRTLPMPMLTLACVAAGVGGGVALHQTAFKQQSAPRAPLALAKAAPAPAQAEVAPQVQQPVPALPQAQPEPALVAEVAVPAPEQIRSQLRWVTLQQGQRMLDANSRLLLARSAAQQAALHDVGLDFRDVYGVIHAESSWLPRPGMGKNGVVSSGLAQFEPATARAVGLRNPADPVEAVHAAAVLLKEAARWSARKLEGLNLDSAQRAIKLREGVSVYYNLSSRGRQAWQGHNSQQLPIETRLHIRNVRDGALRAERLTSGTGLATQLAVPAVATALAPEAAPVMVRTAAAGTRTRASFSGSAPRRAEAAAWIRTRDSITLPEGSIRWTARESRPTGG